MKIQLNTTVNDVAVSVEIDPDARLLDVLRDDLGLIGTKEGCGVGECGACTVIVNGKTANSCITLAASMEGCDIKTIEYLSKDGELHPMQESFIDNSALQCGFCTPGFVLSGISLLERNPNATTEEIKEGLSGNICRCTGYEQIIKAVEDVRDKKYNKDGASNE
jgi:aerobic carbon-monoxide dehydrogenase small subunit